MHRTILAAALCCTAAIAEPAFVATEQGNLKIDTVASDLAHPWGISVLPDGRLLVSEASMGLALEPGRRASTISMTTSMCLMRSSMVFLVRCMCPGNHWTAMDFVFCVWDRGDCRRDGLVS